MKVIHDASRLQEVVTQCDLPSLFTDFQQVKSALSLVLFEKNDYIYVNKEHIQYLYFFVEGKLKVCSHLSNGKSHLLHFYTEFEMLGDLELFQRANPYTTVQAMTDSICIALALHDTRQLLDRDPIFLRHVCETLCAKLYVSSSNNALSILSPLENRLASYILAAGKRAGPCGRERLILDENLTELAEQLGTSYRHLNRTLRGLSSTGVLRKCKRHYEVVEDARLHALAQDNYLVSSVPRRSP